MQQGGMNELMRQAARLQRKMDEIRDKLKDQEMSSTSAGGKIEVTVSCEGKVRRIAVDEKFLGDEGLEMALDAVVAAINTALDAADKHVEAELAKVTGGLKIPGVTG